MKDTLFTEPHRAGQPFEFNKDVAEVFDDMLERSIPHYQSIQSMISTLSKTYAQPKTAIIDLGCSTGHTLCNLATQLSSVSFVGVDLSKPMLDQAELRQEKTCPHQDIAWIAHDLNTPITLEPASVIILNLCYQFIDPVNKPALLSTCYDALSPGGAVIVVEKILAGDHQQQFQTFYEEFKAEMGYSPQEIAGKTASLKGVLHAVKPETLTEDLTQAGFESIERFFQWFNFMGMIGVKRL